MYVAYSLGLLSMDFIKQLPGYFQPIFEGLKKLLKRNEEEPFKIRIDDDENDPLYIQLPKDGKLSKTIKIMSSTGVTILTRGKQMTRIIKSLKRQLKRLSDNPYDPIDQTDEYLEREQEKEDRATRKLADSIIKELEKNEEN